MYAIDHECFQPGISYSRLELQFYLKRIGVFAIVAEWDPSAKPKSVKGSVAGFTIIEIHPKGFGHVITIDVRAEARRAGLGTQLMQAAEQRVAERGGQVMVLETAVDNTPAITFYKRHDYIVVKTIPRYYKGELDALLMTKRIAVPAGAANPPVANPKS